MIEKEPETHVKRMERYSNNENTLTWDFGIGLEADKSVVAGGLAGAVRRHGRRALKQDQEVILRV